jgi:hypothetical protein
MGMICNYDQQFAFIVHAFQKLSQCTGARNPAFLKNVGVFGPGIVQASAELKSQWMAERLKHQNQPQSRDTRRLYGEIHRDSSWLSSSSVVGPW